MIDKKYLDKIKEITNKYSENNERFFVFGSSVTEDKFSDIDLGFVDGKIDEDKLRQLKDELEESLLPYKFDVVDFNKADKEFRDKNLNSKIIWLT